MRIILVLVMLACASVVPAQDGLSVRELRDLALRHQATVFLDLCARYGIDPLADRPGLLLLPNDAAFGLLSSEESAVLAQAASLPAVRTLVAYHVAPTRVWDAGGIGMTSLGDWVYDRISNGAVYLYRPPPRDAEARPEPFQAKVVAGPFDLSGGIQVLVVDRVLVPHDLDGKTIRSRPHPRAVVAAFDERAAMTRALVATVDAARRSGDNARLVAILRLALDGAGTMLRGGDTRRLLQEALAGRDDPGRLQVVAGMVEQDLRDWLERERMEHAPATARALADP